MCIRAVCNGVRQAGICSVALATRHASTNWTQTKYVFLSRHFQSVIRRSLIYGTAKLLLPTKCKYLNWHMYYIIILPQFSYFQCNICREKNSIKIISNNFTFCPIYIFFSVRRCLIKLFCILPSVYFCTANTQKESLSCLNCLSPIAYVITHNFCLFLSQEFLFKSVNKNK